MATIEGFYTAHVIDDKGVKATVPIYFQVADTHTLADLFEQIGEELDLMDKLTDGYIYKTTTTFTGGPPPSTTKTGPAANSDVEKTGLFNFGQQNTSYKYGIDIPAFALAKLSGGRINFADTDVKAWIDAMKTAGTIFSHVSKFAHLLVSIIDALVSFRKRRKQLDRATFEEAPSDE